jgi:hypothetical protein
MEIVSVIEDKKQCTTMILLIPDGTRDLEPFYPHYTFSMQGLDFAHAMDSVYFVRQAGVMCDVLCCDGNWRTGLITDVKSTHIEVRMTEDKDIHTPVDMHLPLDFLFLTRPHVNNKTPPRAYDSIQWQGGWGSTMIQPQLAKVLRMQTATSA